MKGDAKGAAFTLRLLPRTHEAIRYIAAVRGEPLHAAAAHLLARGISALRADPEWQAKAAAHETERAAALAGLGVSDSPDPPDVTSAHEGERP